ncbi:unnamed protein product [Rotaria sordida]|uniref:Apple domain-containing protein n=2 Tax=Rotaria sordida TaxID=392033 RepID=A0A814GUH8_9BILA|nr:unnamed protein product [Rotaria sordida]CAF3968212.1 unnamed protein product [Rotaria sordida]
MLIRFCFLLLLYDLLSDKIDGLISAQSCADIIRPSQNYTPADPTLKIGTISTSSYQECGKRCRVTTLCRTAVWCQGQCTMYQEYIAFGIRLPNLNCMLITLSGIAFNEIEPVVTIAKNVVYEASQSKYYEQTYMVNSLDECIQLCRLDSHCLTASYQSSTNNCSLFAEHVSQGRNYTNFDWTTIVLDTCAGRDPRIYPCLIDATQAHRKLCDLFWEIQPIKLDPQKIFYEPNGYTGWLTKSSVYWPMTINGEGIILRASYDIKIVDPVLIEYELETINEKYFHINIDEHTQIPIAYVVTKSLIDNKIYRIHLKEQKITANNFLNNFLLEQRCQWCYFATDGSNNIFVSMDNSDSIEQYDNNGKKMNSIYLSSPTGIIIRNYNIWIVNNSQLIILDRHLLLDQTYTYRIKNQFDLTSFYNLPITNPLIFSHILTFVPFHLDVDNYGRIYVTGALLDILSDNNRYSPGNNPQLYILTDSEQEIPSSICAGPWGMFGVNVYHSKLKLRMLTSTNDFIFHLYSSP